MPEELPAVLIMGVLITLGSILGLLSEKVNFPRIVIYILVGVVFSPDLLGGLFNFSTEGWSPVITDIALGIIAYIIGSEINPSDLKKEEGIVTVTVIGQSLGVLLFVGLGLWGLSKIYPFHEISFYHALIFGAVATATAPAATLGIIEEYKAKGKLTNTLLGIIAVDDAIGIIFFTLILGMGAEGSFSGSILEGITEVGGSLLLGTGLGIVLGILGKFLEKEELRLATIIGFIFLVFGISSLLGLSLLLSCMTLGFVSVLFYQKKQAEWLLPLQHIEELVFLFFFTLAGIQFEIHSFLDSMLLVLLYVFLRVLGKYSGAYTGMYLIRTEKKTRHLLGLCLFPQAGVAIGLAIRAGNQPGFEETGALLLNVILGSTILFELITPFVTRFALREAGEIETKAKKDTE
ncbi:cation:proton antiporter [Salinimicrobium flavum]|uniref:Cation:proton antiporter n=1 Tax=Salinimicrobium flavum TaxID=1737065 RepID=A0ABW5ISD8_9FLAO